MKKTILVAQEDNKSLDALMLLLHNVYEVITADDGLDAWEIFKEPDIEFNLIITDLKLRRLSGLELLEKIREVDEWVPVILVAGSLTLESAEQALYSGAQSYFKKPVNSYALLKKISRLLNGPRSKLNVEPFGIIKTTAAPPFIQSVLRELHTKFNKRVNFHKIATSLDISEEHLCRKFKEACHLTPHDYLERLRLHSAIRLLAETGYSLEEIAGLTGFYDKSHFIHTFKEFVGTTPQRLRERMKETGEDVEAIFSAIDQNFTPKRSKSYIAISPGKA
jgi:YesN/AraC family two-component response regulator